MSQKLVTSIYLPRSVKMNEKLKKASEATSPASILNTQLE